MRGTSYVAKRLAASIGLIILLTMALCVTTSFLAVTMLSAEGKATFRAGEVRLNLNNGRPVITDECVFAPGIETEKSFTIENLSTCAVWYKLYFTNVSGALADKIRVRIYDGETLLAQGNMAELNEKMPAFVKSLAAGEKKTLTATFRFDESAGDDLQGRSLEFDFCAKAVQVRNNPDKSFE